MPAESMRLQKTTNLVIARRTKKEWVAQYWGMSGGHLSLDKGWVTLVLPQRALPESRWGAARPPLANTDSRPAPLDSPQHDPTISSRLDKLASLDNLDDSRTGHTERLKGWVAQHPPGQALCSRGAGSVDSALGCVARYTSLARLCQR